MQSANAYEVMPPRYAYASKKNNTASFTQSRISRERRPSLQLALE